MAETAIQFLERWRQEYIYAEPRALEQLDETVTECAADAAELGISANELEKVEGPGANDPQFLELIGSVLWRHLPITRDIDEPNVAIRG